MFFNQFLRTNMRCCSSNRNNNIAYKQEWNTLEIYCDYVTYTGEHPANGCQPRATANIFFIPFIHNDAADWIT